MQGPVLDQLFEITPIEALLGMLLDVIYPLRDQTKNLGVHWIITQRQPKLLSQVSPLNGREA